MREFSAAGPREAAVDRARSKSARLALLRSTGLSGAAAALIVLAPQAAMAADECGPPVAGVVTCAAGTELPEGVAYAIDPATPQDLTIVLEDGLTIVTDGHIGVVAGNLNGAVTVSGANADIITSGDGASGIFAHTVHGDVDVEIRDVTINGGNAGGIDLSTGDGDIKLKANSVAVYGEGSTGVNVLSAKGDVDAEIGFVGTLGAGGDAINVQAAGGSAHISVGEVFTGGDRARGVYAITSGDLTVAAGLVTTYGDRSSGIIAVSGVGPAEGDESGPGSMAGIEGAAPASQLSVTVGDVRTFGASSAGIVAANYGTGGVSVSADWISTTGPNSTGVVALTLGGDISVDVDNVTTTGNSSAGVIALNYGDGAIMIDAGHVNTRRDYATGITAIGNGAVTVAAETIDTRGAFSHGVYAVGGEVTITADTVTTLGDGAVGVYAAALDGAANITVGSVSTQGENAQGVRGFSAGGGVNITVTGDVTTTGDRAYGLLGFGTGAVTIDNQGSVTASGRFTRGIYAIAQLAPVSVVNSGSVTVTGHRASGIKAKALNADVNVQSTGTVSASGFMASGILAGATRPGRNEGDVPAIASEVTVVADSVHATGDLSVGIVAYNYTGGDLFVDVAEIASSGAVARGLLVGTNGDVVIHAGDISSTSNAIFSQGVGDRDITVTGAITSSAGTAIATYSGEGDSTVNVGAGASVIGGGKREWGYGDGNGITISTSRGVSTINNAGLIATKGDGWVIEALGEIDITGYDPETHAVINNTGEIVGGIKLTDGDDVVNNAGRLVVTQTSLFNKGDDVLANTGVLRAVGSVSLLGLERFENTGGLVDLRDGHAGDVLTLSGDYVASGDARLGLDLGEGVWDSLVVQGAASGKTAIVLGLAPAEATLATPFARAGQVGIAAPATPLIQLGAGSTATFEIANPDVGLIHYGLTFDPATSSFSLAAAAGAPVYATLDLQTGGQAAWRQSADAWSAHRAAMRVDARGAEAGRTWAQVYGANTGADGYDQTDRGVQVGRDLGARSTRLGEVVWGVTGGYGTTRIEAKAGAGESELETLDVGGYVGLVRGAAFVDGLVKYDRHQIRTSDADAGYKASLDGGAFGAQLEAGRRFGDARLAFEPTVSLAYVRTSLDDVEVLGQTLAFDDADSLTGRIGARVSGLRQAGGTDLVFFAGASAVQTFAGDGGLTFESGGVSQAVTAEDEGAWGQASLGVSARLAHGLTTYLEGEGAFGGREGVGLRLGARFNF